MSRDSEADGSSRLPRPRALLFDWDSTLVDNWGAIHAAMNATLGTFGLDSWTIQDCRNRIKTSLRDGFPGIFASEANSALTTYLTAYEQIHLGHLKPMPAASSMLNAAQDLGLYLGIVSNKTGPNLRSEVEHLGWSGYFRRIVGAADAARDKPAPDPVHLALDLSGIAAGPEVWFIGDTDIDMLCARNSGCTGILLNGTPTAAETAPQPA